MLLSVIDCITSYSLTIKVGVLCLKYSAFIVLRQNSL